MGELFSGLLAIVSGGATGLIGVVAQRLFDHWKLKQENDKLRLIHEHERGMKKLDAEIMMQEWTQRVKVAEVEAAGKEAVADSQAFAASFALEPKRYAEGVKTGKWCGAFLILADVLRGIVRPGLTLYLAWIATALYNDSQALLQGSRLEGTTLVAVHQQIVFTLLYLFTTCVLWWFGTRNKAPQPKMAAVGGRFGFWQDVSVG